MQAGIVNFDVEVSADGDRLYFVDGVFRPGAEWPLESDLVVATRQGASFRRLERSAAIFARINTAALEYAAGISADGFELFFTRFDPSAKPALPAIYRSVRSGPDEPFEPGRRVSAIRGFAEGPTLSPDGNRLYYHRKDGTRHAIYQVSR
jgi:hypothetical protein